MTTPLIRVAAVALGAAATLMAVPTTAHAAPPAPPRITVDDVSGHEGTLICSDGFGDPPCGTIVDHSLLVYVRISAAQKQDVVVGWQLVDGTATAGSDYAGPTSGTITIAKNTYANSMYLPLIYDGVGESTEQFTLQLTSSSIPANLTDTGNETILDGTQLPADCTASNPASGVIALDCTGRPANQQWQLQTWCWPFGRLTVEYGNIVTGNGESIVDCGGAPIENPQFRVV